MRRRETMPQDVFRRVEIRAGGRCEARVGEAGCVGRDEHKHHRQYRSRGGKDTPENLIAVCHRCHDWIHRNVSDSTARGLSVSRYRDPADVPVIRLGKTVTLDSLGGWANS